VHARPVRTCDHQRRSAHKVGQGDTIAPAGKTTRPPEGGGGALG